MSDPNSPESLRAGAESEEQFLSPDDEIMSSEDVREQDLPDGEVEEIDVDLATVNPELADAATVAEIVAADRTVHAEVGEPLLRMEGVTVKFGGLTALDDVSFDIRRGEILGLIGPNGAGKTTAFNAMTGVYRPSSGRVVFDDRPLVRVKRNEITRLGIARTFQNIRLFSDMTALENVVVGTDARHRTSVPGAIFRSARHRR